MNGELAVMEAYVREWRLHLGKRQTDLAKATGVTNGEISRLENGVRRMTTDWINKIAEALNITPIDLVSRPPNSPNGKSASRSKKRFTTSRFPIASVDPDVELMSVAGDEMCPTVSPGEMVVIDMGRASPNPPGIFAVREQGEIVLRRIHITGEKIRVSFDNTVYPPYEADPNKVDIVGRAVFRLHRI